MSSQNPRLRWLAADRCQTEAASTRHMSDLHLDPSTAAHDEPFSQPFVLNQWVDMCNVVVRICLSFIPFSTSIATVALLDVRLIMNQLCIMFTDRFYLLEAHPGYSTVLVSEDVRTFWIANGIKHCWLDLEIEAGINTHSQAHVISSSQVLWCSGSL